MKMKNQIMMIATMKVFLIINLDDNENDTEDETAFIEQKLNELSEKENKLLSDEKAIEEESASLLKKMKSFLN